MNNLLQKYVFKLCMTLIFITQSAYSETEVLPPIQDCTNSNYVIGFFNGVNNTVLQAASGATALLNSTTGSIFDAEEVHDILFYNQTGSLMEDVAEVFQQRSQEFDGVLANRWEVFWEALASGSDDDSIITKISNINDAHEDLIDALITAINAKIGAGTVALIQDPPTSNDIENQISILTELLLQHDKIVLVAHSQGNLFVNTVYDYPDYPHQGLTLIGGSMGANGLVVGERQVPRAGVFHIAPASPTLRGEYVLADIDSVINVLDPVFTSNVIYPALHLILDDPSGHKLIETYLHPERPALVKIQSNIQDALRDQNRGSRCTTIPDLNPDFN